MAAHEASTLPWLTTVGWDGMLTPEGVVFFEGNVAAYRTPRTTANVDSPKCVAPSP